jgi:phosphoribosylamine--glycine ligase
VKVLVVGSGGREHALAWKLSHSGQLEELHAAPGNPGIASLGTCHPVRPEDGDGLLELARTLEIDLVVVGPEAPLVAGVTDELRRGGVSVFGPSAAAARIEGSKSFAKEVMDAAGVPNPRRLSEPKAPCVVKVDGLAAGKGVFVCRTETELERGVRGASALGGALVVEELLEGTELSVFALCDGTRALPLGAARDYKRVDDGDAGPNTGGMGAYSPVDGFSPDRIAELVEQIHAPVIEQLARRGAPFIGVLFAGLMLAADGPHVLEFNCRFGDPETQTILPTLDDDLLPALAAAAAGDAGGIAVTPADAAAVTVVVAAGGYPEEGDSGSTIGGVDEAERRGALVFHAGTALRGNALVTNGGRILGVTGRGATVPDARERAYEAVAEISFPGARYRRDIARLATDAG